MMNGELWKRHPVYVKYFISNKGRVRGPRGKIIRMCRDKGGYFKLSVCHKGWVYCRSVHVLVLETFVGRRPSGLVACHNDGDPGNNSVANLRWDTASNNELDKRAHGTMRDQRGERAAAAKITRQDVSEIRRTARSACRPLGIPQTVLAAKFGISQSQVSRIVSGNRWIDDGGKR